MSKYKETLQNEKEQRLDELILSAKRTLDEIAPLQVYLNMIKGQIKDIFNELDIDEYKSAKRVKEETILLRLDDFVNYNTDLQKYATVVVDRADTLSNMYRNNIDYKVAERLLDTAIDKSKEKVRLDERITIKI